MSPSIFMAKEKIASAADIPSPMPLEGGKVSQVAAKYRDADVRCSNCSHFMPPNSCDVVDGEINPEGSSDKFERKGGTFDDADDVDGDGLSD